MTHLDKSCYERLAINCFLYVTCFACRTCEPRLRKWSQMRGQVNCICGSFLNSLSNILCVHCFFLILLTWAQIDGTWPMPADFFAEAISVLDEIFYGTLLWNNFEVLHKCRKSWRRLKASMEKFHLERPRLIWYENLNVFQTSWWKDLLRKHQYFSVCPNVRCHFKQL